ncbi:hypothetical protein ABEW05_011367 [Botrytis cinerea]
MSNKPMGMPAPRKLRIETITEEAPSYDSNPTITSYRRQLEPNPRPLYAHRVYDTTPDAAIPGRAAELAKILHEKTLDYRGGYGRDEPDRIEVVALPMPKDATAEQRVKKCKAHHLAEVASREKEWHLSRTFVHNGYQRAIVIIDQLREEWREAFDRPFEMFGVLPSKRYLDWRWESNMLPNMNSPDWETNPYGTYLLAEWDLETIAELQRMLEEDGASIPEEDVSPHALVHLDKDLRGLRRGIEQYYIEYAGQGLIEEELSLRASGGDWEHVKPMNARVHNARIYVCAFDTEVQLTQSYDGGGDNCGIQLSRDRVFCCTAPGGVQPFLPVHLEYLFANPLTGDDVDAKYKLSVDDTRSQGSGRNGQLYYLSHPLRPLGQGGDNTPGSDSTPNDAAFGFFVMVSPEALLVSLRKRDGTHWEMLDCENTKSEESQIVWMFCNDDSPNSNCNKIYLDHGVPGTILDMPNGCGPGPYAVAVNMVPSKNQVPRDLGDTQWRLDYSNEEGYWDTVVDSPGMRRRKRSFEEQRGNHREFLEESWHADLSDHRSGLLTRDELHSRWFGSDAIAWLKQLFTVEVSTSPITHSVSETLNVILLDETYQCTISDVDVSAKLLVEAQTSVDIDTSFGLTMIATLGIKVDLSGSYLWFKNSGTVEALFMIDALVSAQYDTGDVELFGLENFGATFAIPEIVTVGPNFKLYGSVNFDLSLSGQFEAHVALADWDTQLAFPDQESDADPKSTDSPGTNGTQEVSKPTIDWSVNTNGQITAHVKPVASFGIDFNSNFISVPSTTINLVAGGWVTAYASAVYSSTDADFCYGASVGASLYVSLDVPPPLQWALPGGVSQYPLWSSPQHAIIEQTCSATEPNTTSHTKRDLLD